MDVLYFLRHSERDDVEIRYSLRSIEKYYPNVGKVWIMGDRPAFLTDDRELVEHVPHSYLARVSDFRVPVTNFFLMLYLGILIPELTSEFLWFCDDFILIDELSEESARQTRYLEDLDAVKNRGRGLWKDSLWRTYDLLKRFRYPVWNFETHTPTYFRKRWILEAYCEFRDFVTQDRWQGMLGPTAVLNYAAEKHGVPLHSIRDEGCKVGFYGSAPAYDKVLADIAGKAFLSFDDPALGEDLLRCLAERFPDPSRYERVNEPVVSPIFDAKTKVSNPVDPAETRVTRAKAGVRSSPYPEVLMPNRARLPHYLNELGLVGQGAEIGTLRGDFASHILQHWQGECLHCVDSWQAVTDERYVDINNVTQEQHDQNYARACKVLASFEERCRIHHMMSSQAAGLFEDGTLDFVYLDSRHYADAVCEDLALWTPKVRPGGLICGHDYLDGVLPSGVFEVKTSVDAWAAEQGYVVYCSGEHVWRSWFVQKPRSTPQP